MKLRRKSRTVGKQTRHITLASGGCLRAAIAIPLLAATLPLMSEAGRPLAVDDAQPVARNQVEVEAGAMFSDDGMLRHWDFPMGLAYGLAPQWEISIATGGHLEERVELATGDNLTSGISDIIVGTKVQVAGADRFFADHALALAVKIPTASRHYGLGTGEVDVDLMWIATRQVTENMAIHLNTAFLWVGDPAGEDLSDVFHGGIAAGWQCTPQLELVAEFYGNIPVRCPDEPELFVNGGVRWKIRDAVVLDAALGAGVRGDTPGLIGTLGFTCAFD